MKLVSISSLLLLLVIKNALGNFENGSLYTDGCQGDDPLACSNLGICKDGIKDYSTLFEVNNVGQMDFEKRGMYCLCPDDKPNIVFGLSGLHCTTEFERCDNDQLCFNGGYCEADSAYDTFHCACPMDKAYAGFACESTPKDRSGFCSDDDVFTSIAGYPWFCVNGGTCNDGETDISLKCECPAKYAGIHCEFLASEYEHCSLDCSGVGTCKKGAQDLSLYIEYGMDINEIFGGSNINGEHCVCPEGYSGVNCQLEAQKDNFIHCGNGLCFNGGLCVERVHEDGTVKDYYCACNELGFRSETNVAGQFCEHKDVEFCPFPENHDPSQYYCANGGTCPLVGNEHDTCGCTSGWTGPRCEIRVENEEESNERNECDLDCQNGGNCFFGDNPNQDSSLDVIPGLEFLQDNKHCRCPSGYIGLRCEMRYEKCGDNEHYCLHGSGCVSDNDQFTCDCNEVSTALIAYAGHYCEHTAAEFCVGPGAGKHSFCTSHGTCRGEVGLGQDHVGCDCEAGWTGDYCEYQLDLLHTNGIATTIFVSFIIGTISLAISIGVTLCLRRKSTYPKDVSYETTAVPKINFNPYGDEEDEDEDEDDSELTEITII